MVQPSGGLRWPLLAAAEIWCCVQVAPPSRETATWSAAGAALPFSWPWNIAQQTYTLPKNGLEVTTGFIHEFLSRMLPGVGLSMRETAMASNPLKLLPVGKFDVRLE